MPKTPLRPSIRFCQQSHSKSRVATTNSRRENQLMVKKRTKRRVWECPICERRYKIRATAKDPVACPKCAKLSANDASASSQPAATPKASGSSNKKVVGAVVFMAGAFLGASTRTDLWNDLPMLVWYIALVAAFSICGFGVTLWNSGDTEQ